MAEHGTGAVRVLLLARAGEARQRLESALAEAGAELLRAVDPLEGNPDEAIGLRPGAVLVALEPAIEDALERYDALLTDPRVLVIFDEAELAAQRDGWDAARWVRHLAAKLNGHQDVLPPGAEIEEAIHPAPGPLPDREFDPAQIDIDALTGTARGLAGDVPRGEGFDIVDAPEAADAPGAIGQDEAVDAEDVVDLGAAVADFIADADADADAEPEPGFEAAPFATNADVDDAADDVTDDAADPGDAASAGPSVATDHSTTTFGAGFAGLVSAEDMDWSSTSITETSLDADPELAALLASSAAAQADAEDTDPLEAGLSFDASDLSLADEPVEAPASTDDDGSIELAGLADGIDAAGTDAAKDAGPDPLSLGDGFSLADDDAPIQARREDAGAAIDLDALSARLEGLSLADPDSYGHGVLRGAVLVEAGLGGPDAVRQLLGGLGAEFSRAVLVRLQLDGGRYDRLVQQMQRATELSVALAEAGASAEPGTVYFLQPGICVSTDRARLVFEDAGEGQAGGYDALPATDTALVFLSGADIARTDAALALGAAGALVLAQAPTSCYDGAAVGALVERGATAAEPGDLAQALLDRWP